MYDIEVNHIAIIFPHSLLRTRQVIYVGDFRMVPLQLALFG